MTNLQKCTPNIKKNGESFVWISRNKSWAVTRKRDGEHLLRDFRVDPRGGTCGTAHKLTHKALHSYYTPAYVRNAIIESGIPVV